MFEWCEEYMEMFGCDWDTVAREYYFQFKEEFYDAENYEDD